MYRASFGPLRESDNRKWSAAAGDRRAVDGMRRNLSGNNRSPEIAELLAHELMDCGRRVHLCRAWNVLSFGIDGFHRWIPEIDHQLALALLVVGALVTSIARPVPPVAPKTRILMFDLDLS